MHSATQQHCNMIMLLREVRFKQIGVFILKLVTLQAITEKPVNFFEVYPVRKHFHVIII